MSPLITVDQLIAEQNGPDEPIVLDCTFHLPDQGDPAVDYAQARIPGAIRFGVDTLARTDTDLPHMLPGPDDAAAIFAAAGIDATKPVVVYDRSKQLGAARVWWSFRVYGLPAPRVLDGGLAAWIAAGGTLESGPAAPAKAVALPKLSWNAALFADLASVQTAIESRDALILDARAADRFTGAAPEPRPGLRAGHIPASKNLPSSALVDAEGRFLPLDDDQRALLKGPVIASCGTGVSACVIALAAAAADLPDVAVYDGSWSEWGRPDGPPIESGS